MVNQKHQTGFAKHRPGWARWPWPTWGRGVRFVRWAHDVGLDPLVLSCQEERTRIQTASAVINPILIPPFRPGDCGSSPQIVDSTMRSESMTVRAWANTMQG